ncbi:TPA: hypothetical protein EYP27_06820 [Candidatus Bathyarchaeota archaeon]|nr:hypothetical protein [Candidatus Bathyarchaeota archaeon]
MKLSAGEKLKLLLYNMRTGHLESYEFDIASAEGGVYKVYLPHSLYHKVETHFGKGPYTTVFTLTHGNYMLYGHLKNNREAKVTIEFEEK